MPEDIIKKFKDQYGSKKGKSIYYATANKQGRDPETFKKKEEECSCSTKDKLRKMVKDCIDEILSERGSVNESFMSQLDSVFQEVDDFISNKNVVSLENIENFLTAYYKKPEDVHKFSQYYVIHRAPEAGFKYDDEKQLLKKVKPYTPINESVDLTTLSPNCNAVTVGGKVLLFSYQTLVGVVDLPNIYITDRKYSRTTSKHIKLFLNQYKGPNTKLVPTTTDQLQALAEK